MLNYLQTRAAYNAEIARLHNKIKSCLRCDMDQYYCYTKKLSRILHYSLALRNVPSSTTNQVLLDKFYEILRA